MVDDLDDSQAAMNPVAYSHAWELEVLPPSTSPINHSYSVLAIKAAKAFTVFHSREMGDTWYVVKSTRNASLDGGRRRSLACSMSFSYHMLQGNKLQSRQLDLSPRLTWLTPRILLRDLVVMTS